MVVLLPAQAVFSLFVFLQYIIEVKLVPPTSTSFTTPCKQSIPYSQFLRLCSNDKDFETISLEMRTFFLERGYPTHLFESTMQKAFGISRRHTTFGQNF